MRRCVVVLLLLLLSACSAPTTYLPTGTAAPGTGIGSGAPPGPGETIQPALLERRMLQLNWPARIREKDSDRVDLIIALDPQALVTATAAQTRTPNQNEDIPVDIPNIYETHNLMAVARLDIAGMEAIREEIREPLLQGREVSFHWSVRANETGMYRGVVWLHLEMVPKTGGAVERILLLARPIDIEAYTVFGMSGSLARTLGVLGLIASTLLGYPFIQKLFDSLFQRKREAPQPPAANRPPPTEIE